MNFTMTNHAKDNYISYSIRMLSIPNNARISSALTENPLLKLIVSPLKFTHSINEVDNNAYMLANNVRVIKIRDLYVLPK